MSIFWRCDMMRYHFISLRTVRPNENPFPHLFSPCIIISFLSLSLCVSLFMCRCLCPLPLSLDVCVCVYMSQSTIFLCACEFTSVCACVCVCLSLLSACVCLNRHTLSLSLCLCACPLVFSPSVCNCVSVCQSLTLSFYLSSSFGPLVGSFNYAPKMNWTNIGVLECGWYSFNGRSHRSWRRRRRRRRRRPSADVGLRKTQNEEMFIITTRVWLLSNFLARRFLRYFELTSCSLSHKILFFWAMGLAQLDIIRYEVLSIWFNCQNSMISWTISDEEAEFNK